MLGGELGATLAATGGDDRPTGASAHPETEAVGLRTTAVVRLEGTLRHEKTPGGEPHADARGKSACPVGHNCARLPPPNGARQTLAEVDGLSPPSARTAVATRPSGLRDLHRPPPMGVRSSHPEFCTSPSRYPQPAVDNLVLPGACDQAQLCCARAATAHTDPEDEPDD